MGAICIQLSLGLLVDLLRGTLLRRGLALALFGRLAGVSLSGVIGRHTGGRSGISSARLGGLAGVAISVTRGGDILGFGGGGVLALDCGLLHGGGGVRRSFRSSKGVVGSLGGQLEELLLSVAVHNTSRAALPAAFHSKLFVVDLVLLMNCRDALKEAHALWVDPRY